MEKKEFNNYCKPIDNNLLEDLIQKMLEENPNRIPSTIKKGKQVYYDALNHLLMFNRRLLEDLEDNNIKDNPVPSLDKLLEEFHKEHMIITNGTYSKLVAFKEYLKQNGVETNKEQPNTNTGWEGIESHFNKG